MHTRGLALLLLAPLACSTTQPVASADSDTRRQLDELARRQDAIERRLADLDTRMVMLADKVERAGSRPPPSLDVVALPPTRPGDEEAERDDGEIGAQDDGSEPVVIRLHGNETRAAGGAEARGSTVVAERYEKARALYQAGNFDAAAAAFDEIASRHPAHDLADNAVFWRGACLQEAGRHERAIEQLQQVAVRYPRSDKVPDALLRIGQSYRALGDGVSARVYLAQLVEQFPTTDAARQGRELLAEKPPAP
jgi:tol-pal system protein YbgF